MNKRKLKQRNKRFWSFVLAVILVAGLYPFDFGQKAGFVQAAEDGEYLSKNMEKAVSASATRENDADVNSVLESDEILDDAEDFVEESMETEKVDSLFSEEEEEVTVESVEADPLYANSYVGSVSLHTEIYYVDQSLNLPAPVSSASLPVNPDVGSPTIDPDSESISCGINDDLSNYEFDKWYCTSAVGKLDPNDIPTFVSNPKSVCQEASPEYVDYATDQNNKPILE